MFCFAFLNAVHLQVKNDIIDTIQYLTNMIINLFVYKTLKAY